MSRTFYLYLITYIIFCGALCSQNLILKINGGDTFETKIIDSLNYIKNHQNYSSIKLEVDSIKKRLYKIGYIENELKEILKVNDSSFSANIILKKKYNRITIYYDNTIVSGAILKVISKNISDDFFELEFQNLENALNFINTKNTEKGFPFSKLHLTNIEVTDSTSLSAKLTIKSTDQKRTLSNVIIKGYEKFPRTYLKHYLKIKPSQVFDLKKIKNKTALLNDLRFASEVKSPEVLFTKDSTTLYLYLQKTKSNNFDGFLGFGTNEETSKLEFDGYLNLNLTNNLNFGESFRLQYKSDENDQKMFQTDVSLPYLFKSPVGIDLLLRIFKRDSSFTTVNQSVKLHYQINSKHKVYAGILSTESNNLLTQNTNISITDYKTNYFTFAYQYLKPQSNSLLFPIKTQFFIESGFGKRKQTIGTEKQSQFIVDAFKIFNLNYKNSIYIRINGVTLNSNTYLENELLRFGGINSIRGFEENSLFASLYGLINTEYRYHLSGSIYIHTIFDAAYFENKIQSSEEKLFSYGFGFGILTKAGVFKFNYANGKNENSTFKLSNSKIHLSLTADF